jgi:hypothetical protein
MSRIVSFRGLIADGVQDTISLHTRDGSSGYRIVKFELMPNNPTNADYESVVKIYSIEQAAITTGVDFSDQTLLAAGTYSQKADTTYYPDNMTTIFDEITFNQDIYVSHYNDGGLTAAMNYYIVLEQIKLDLNENTVATLKDIRNVA